MVDHVTDVIRPCPLDLVTLDYLHVTPDSKYLLGIDGRRKRLAVYTVSKYGKHDASKKACSRLIIIIIIVKYIILVRSAMDFNTAAFYTSLKICYKLKIKTRKKIDKSKTFY